MWVRAYNKCCSTRSRHTRVGWQRSCESLHLHLVCGERDVLVRAPCMHAMHLALAHRHGSLKRPELCMAIYRPILLMYVIMTTIIIMDSSTTRPWTKSCSHTTSTVRHSTHKIGSHLQLLSSPPLKGLVYCIRLSTLLAVSLHVQHARLFSVVLSAPLPFCISARNLQALNMAHSCVFHILHATNHIFHVVVQRSARAFLVAYVHHTIISTNSS